MLQKIFIFGVILPTVITVILFIAFLVCWFKFDLRGKLFPKKKGDWLEKSASFQTQADENPNSQINFVEENKKDPGNPNGSKKGDKGSKNQASFIFRINGHLNQPYQPMEDCLSLAEEDSYHCNPCATPTGALPPGTPQMPCVDLPGNYANCSIKTDDTEEIELENDDEDDEVCKQMTQTSLVIQTFQFHEQDTDTLQCVGPDVETDCDDSNYSELVPKSKIDEEKWDKKHKQFKKWRDKKWVANGTDIHETESETSKLVVAT